MGYRCVFVQTQLDEKPRSLEMKRNHGIIPRETNRGPELVSSPKILQLHRESIAWITIHFYPFCLFFFFSLDSNIYIPSFGHLIHFYLHELGMSTRYECILHMHIHAWQYAKT